jgi:hypothetical protein
LLAGFFSLLLPPYASLALVAAILIALVLAVLHERPTVPFSPAIDRSNPATS